MINILAHRSAPRLRYRWPLLSRNETIWLLQIITFRHHGEITRYLMWHSDWGQRFPGDNKDVILRGCPFSMSQVNYYLPYLSLDFVRMIKIVPLVVLFWPHVFSTSQHNLFIPPSNTRLSWRENPEDLWVNQGIPLTTKFTTTDHETSSLHKSISVVKAELVGPGAEGSNTYVTLKLQSVKSTTVPVKGKKPTWNQDFLL